MRSPLTCCRHHRYMSMVLRGINVFISIRGQRSNMPHQHKIEADEAIWGIIVAQLTMSTQREAKASVLTGTTRTALQMDTVEGFVRYRAFPEALARPARRPPVLFFGRRVCLFP